MSVVLVDAWVAPEACTFFRNVWPMYVHELSGFDTDFYSLDRSGAWQPDIVGDWVATRTPLANLRGAVPEHLQPFQRAHVIVHDERPVGFACVGSRPFKYMPDDADIIIAEFFAIHAARGSGVSRRALELLLARYSGRWFLRALHDNTRAIRFWKETLRASDVRDLEIRTEDRDVTFRFTT